MGIRFSRRIRILPGVYLNFGKSGFSISIGPRGAKLTMGKRGIKSSVGLPGTGIRYETPYARIQSQPQGLEADDTEEEDANARRLRVLMEGKGFGCS